MSCQKLIRIFHKYRIVLIIFFVYFGLHFSIVHYNGTSVLCFVFSPPYKIFSSETKNGILLGYAELDTQFGTIKLKPFCTFNARDNAFYIIDSSNFRAGKAEHNLVVFGNPLIPNIGIGFGLVEIDRGYDYGLDSIYTNQPFTFGEYTFNIDAVFVAGELNIDFVEIRFTLHERPNSIELSDGTMLKFKDKDLIFFMQIVNSWRLRNWRTSDDWRLTEQKLTDWGIAIPWGSNDCIWVKHPNEIEEQPYISVTFGKNWGSFKTGEKAADTERRWLLY